MKPVVALAAALSLTAPIAAPAATADAVITAITARWINPHSSNPDYMFAPRIVDGDSTGTVASIHWSTPMPRSIPSGFTFAPAIGPVALVADRPVSLGTFGHYNGTVSSFGFVLDRVDLLLQVDGHFMDAGRTAFSKPLRYRFTHEETHNIALLPNCPAFQVSAVPCDDRATVRLLPNPLRTAHGPEALLEVLGFRQGSALTGTFITQEQKVGTATLEATFTGRFAAIPAPGAFLLLASALGLSWLWRRHA